MVGAVAQLGEHLLCKQGVSGSIPLSSTKFCLRGRGPADGAPNCRRRPIGLYLEVAVAIGISFEEVKVCTWRNAWCLFW